jgi:molybdopterin-synthase adenylyltransferase
MSPVTVTERMRRYARQLALPEIGEKGQEKLLASSVLVVGAGGLGCPALMYLAAAGVGNLGIIDHDRVELSNLQRQVLFEQADIGRFKAEAARDRLEEMNSDIRVVPHVMKLDEGNAHALVQDYDLIIDGCDNFITRFAVAQACHQEKKILISGAVVGFSGQLSVFKSYLGALYPCYRCFVPEVPTQETSCVLEGVAGALTGMVGAMLALETVKELLNIGESLAGRIVIVDGMTIRLHSAALERDPECSYCKLS